MNEIEYEQTMKELFIEIDRYIVLVKPIKYINITINIPKEPKESEWDKVPIYNHESNI